MVYARRTFQAVAFMLTAMALSVGAIEVQNYTAQSDNLKVTFKPVKEEISIGDQFVFELKTSRDVYLYLFSMDENNNIGQVLLKDVKYKDTETFVPVPDPYSDTTWKADKVGVERFSMIASTKKINQDWDNQDASKALFGLFKKKEQVQINLEVKVSSPEQTPATESSMTSAPVAFVSTARQTYKIGDTVKILYGADQAGTVTLYLEEPSGKREEVLQTNVDGKKFYKLAAKASAPLGDHKLIAEFAAGSNASKGLELPAGAGQHRAVYQFKIVE